jgi:hypothetical protein
MAGINRNTRFGAALAALTIVGFVASAGSANAVVACKRVGYPKGCVATAPVATVAHRPVVYCKRVGYPKGCVVR